jgi:hypothetical protein
VELPLGASGCPQQQVPQGNVLIAREHHVAALVPSDDQVRNARGRKPQVRVGVEDAVVVHRGDEDALRGLRLVRGTKRGVVLAEDGGERIGSRIGVPGLARERLVFRRHSLEHSTPRRPHHLRGVEARL